MVGIFTSDFDSSPTSRKALYGACAFTLISTNAKFITNELNIFGLKLALEQREMIALGRFTVAFFFIVFLLHSVGDFILWVGRSWERERDLWETKTRADNKRINDAIDEDYYGPPPEPEPWDEKLYDGLEERNARILSLSNLYVMFSISKKLGLRYIIPILVATLSLYKPNFANVALSYFAPS